MSEKKEVNLLVCGEKQGRFVVSVHAGENKGAILAEVIKTGVHIFVILEISEEDRKAFANKMNERIATPVKKPLVMK